MNTRIDLDRITAALERDELTVAVAESFTGGMLGKILTDIPGSSKFFLGGAISYSDKSKDSLLSVPGELLAAHGAVSEPVAEAMAEGIRKSLGADISLALTGYAGPDATGETPVGLVYIALSTADECYVCELELDGNRWQVRQHAVDYALSLLAEHLKIEPYSSGWRSTQVVQGEPSKGLYKVREFVFDGRSTPVVSWGRQWESYDGLHFLVQDSRDQVYELLWRRGTLDWWVYRLQEPRSMNLA